MAKYIALLIRINPLLSGIVPVLYPPIDPPVPNDNGPLIPVYPLHDKLLTVNISLPIFGRVVSDEKLVNPVNVNPATFAVPDPEKTTSLPTSFIVIKTAIFFFLYKLNF